MNTRDIPPDRADSDILHGRRILILEDELLVALETKALVWRFGGIVVGPYSRVPAALEAIEVHPLDAAILDVNVAGTKSFVVADALQSRNVPYVFCTGYGRDCVPPRFGHATIVEKPIIPEALVAALARAFKASVVQAEQ